MPHARLALHLLPLVLHTTGPWSVAPPTITLAPATVVGGNAATATITLAAPAPQGGVEITLTSANNGVAQFGGRFGAIGTSQLTIPAGALSAQFPVRTFGVAASTAVALEATASGGASTAVLTVTPASVKTVTLAPASVVGGASVTGTVTLDGEAAASGSGSVSFAVVSPMVPAPASVPAPVTLPAHATSATFVVATTPSATDAPVNLVARYNVGGTPFGAPVSTALTVRAPTPVSVSLNPATVVGGNASSATVTISGPAPTGGLTVSLGMVRQAPSRTSPLGSAPSVTLPPTLVVPAGATQQSTTIGTGTVTATQTVQIVANPSARQAATRGISDGTSNTIVVGESTAPASASAMLTIMPPPPPVVTVSVTPSPTTGGVPVMVTVKAVPNGSSLPGQAALSTDRPDLLQLPASASFPAIFGSAGVTATVNAPTVTTAADQTVTITAQVGGGTGSTTLLVKQTPPPIASFTLRPTAVKGGGNVIAQFTTSPSLGAAVTVSLTSDHPALVPVPSTLQIGPSPVAQPFTFHTSATQAATPVTITATVGAQTLTATLNVVP